MQTFMSSFCFKIEIEVIHKRIIKYPDAQDRTWDLEVRSPTLWHRANRFTRKMSKIKEVIGMGGRHSDHLPWEINWETAHGK